MSASLPLIKNNVTVAGRLDADQTLIFAHGFGSDQSSWSQVAPRFYADYRVILYDNTGSGQSDPLAFSPGRYNSLHAFKDDLLEICAALEVRQAVLLGHSVSGMIGVLAALAEPDTFSRLILIGASPCYLNLDGYSGGFLQSDLDEMYHLMENNYYAWASGFAAQAVGNSDQPHLGEAFADSLRSMRPDVALAVIRVIMQSDYRSELRKITHPTLLLQTREDAFVPMQVAAYMHQQIQGSQLMVVNASGHFPQLSAPAETTSIITTFLPQG